MTNWANNGRHYRGFPTTIRRQAQRDLPPWCNKCGADNVSLELDHIINAASGGTDTIDNAQWLCRSCHDQKTRHERAQGRQRRTQQARHPREPHPGLL
ncbi:HNH endonuclease [Gordonia phage Birdsong]|nr:HNH endonuclease [Gordonia phage BearBQ]